MPAAWTRRRKRKSPPRTHEPARLDLRLPVRNGECEAPARDGDADAQPPERGVAVIDFYL